MGAAPLLIMLAAVGVDYGWQPDGTTSSRGDQLEYIVQISPDQLREIESVGEITSTIDPEIQGRVSRIVVRVGTDPLPQDAGRSLDSDDLALVPLPEIPMTPEISGNRPHGGHTSGSESLMKPDPQAGGFSLPSNLGGFSSDAASSPGTAIVGTHPEVSTDPATGIRDDRWADIRGQATVQASSNQSDRGQVGGGQVGRTASGPSTDPVDSAATNQPTRSSQPDTTNRAGGANQADTRDTAETPRSANTGNAAEPRRPTDPRDPNWSGYGTTSNFGSLPSGLRPPTASGQSQTFAADEPRSDRPGAMENFATTNADRAAATADPNRAADGGAAPTRDAAGNLLDRLGRPVDQLGRLIDPDSGNLVDNRGNWIDEDGRQIDRFGRPLPGQTGHGTPANASLQPPLAGQNAGATIDNRNWQTAAGQGATAQPDYDRGRFGQQTNRSNGGYQPADYPTTNYPATGYPAAGRPATNDTVNYDSLRYDSPAYDSAREPRRTAQQAAPRRLARDEWWDEEEAYASASDRQLSDQPRRRPDDRLAAKTPTTEPLAAEAPVSEKPRTRSVAAQPFFNFILLISLVGNAYLIFETGNLRRKFRNMIANVRANKVSAQPTG